MALAAQMPSRQLPVRHLGSVSAAEAMLSISEPHHITLAGVDCVGDAPAMVRLISERIYRDLAWTFDPFHIVRLHLVARLSTRLRALRRDSRSYVAPGLMGPYRRLRTHAERIRRIGRRDESKMQVLRKLAVKLGNRLKKIAVLMLKGKRTPAWFAARSASIDLHVWQVLEKHYIPLE